MKEENDERDVGYLESWFYGFKHPVNTFTPQPPSHSVMGISGFLISRSGRSHARTDGLRSNGWMVVATLPRRHIDPRPRRFLENRFPTSLSRHKIPLRRWFSVFMPLLSLQQWKQLAHNYTCSPIGKMAQISGPNWWIALDDISLGAPPFYTATFLFMFFGSESSQVISLVWWLVHQTFKLKGKK